MGYSPSPVNVFILKKVILLPKLLIKTNCGKINGVMYFNCFTSKTLKVWFKMACNTMS